MTDLLHKISYQVEPWEFVKAESAWLWPMHWEEVARDKDRIKLDLDIDAYDYLASIKQLVTITVRCDGKIVGYHWSIVRNHLHYKGSLTAYTDVYYIHPEYRKGAVGINLFKFFEQEMRKLGVQKMYSATKTLHDISPIFSYLDWEDAENVHTKYIGD